MWGNTQNNADFLLQMADHESLIAELYTAYANVDETIKELFENIAETEHEHAKSLCDLFKKLTEDKVVVTIEDLEAKQILLKNSTNFIKKQLELTKRKKNLEAHQVLNSAKMIESSLFEHNIFQKMQCQHPLFESTIKKLANETNSHSKSFREALEK